MTKKKSALSGSSAPKPGNHLVISFPDVHFPHQDDAAIGVLLHTIELLRPDVVVGLGDLLDAGKFASHPKKQLQEVAASSFYKDEIKPANLFLDKIQKYSNELVLISGNHEARVEAVAAQLGGPMSAVYDLISPETLLTGNRSNCKWIPYHDELSHYSIAKNLWAIHGTYFGTHAAYSHLQAYKPTSIIFGHVHRAQSHVTRDPATRKIVKAWSPGCLSKLQPLYQQGTPTNWVHGFSLIYVKDDLSEFTEYTLIIEDGQTVLPGGKTVKA